VRFLRRRLAIVSSVALALVAVASPAVAGPSVPAAPTARSVLVEINTIRARHGLRALRPSGQLSAAADQHTLDMGRRGYFRHASFDGAPFWKRVQRFYPAAGYRAWSAGENLLWATAGITSQQALRLWMGSPGHRANILNRRWREIGISARSFAAAPGTFHGGAVTIITTDFGTRRR
jgi:uncharacterized protein YkwD